MGVMSARFASGTTVCFALSARGEITGAATTGATAAWEGGEDGALTEAVSETLLAVLETEAWRGTAGRLERKP